MVGILAWHGWDYGTVVACALGVFAAGLFVVTFYRDAGRDAWSNPFGRFLLVRKLLLVGLFELMLVNRSVGGVVREDTWHGQDAATFFVFMAVAVHTFVPYGILLEAQRAHAEKEEAR